MRLVVFVAKSKQGLNQDLQETVLSTVEACWKWKSSPLCTRCGECARLTLDLTLRHTPLSVELSVEQFLIFLSAVLI